MPRTDKKKNVWKVAKILIENPHATEREIAKKAWIGNWTVNRAKKELEQTGAKDPVIRYIVDKSKETLEKIKNIQDRYIAQVENSDEIQRADVRELNSIAKDDIQRITVLWWDVTDESGGLKITKESVKELSDEELSELL